jgi:murein DD-endopeptidase MepM/ murein hydrolase activator NlpD
MDPIDDAFWEGGVGGHERYAKYKNYRNSGDLMTQIHQKVDKLKRQMVLQSESLDDIEKMAKDKETMLASIPSIKPVRADKLNRGVNLLSGFGYRMHPIHKVVKMHAGIDFSSPRGTYIQATGDGVVKAVLNKKNGYGLHVIISHGYGYETLYGHMSKVDVKVGQKVKKGHHIGKVGSSGTSTAPHCHYEVHYKGKAVNPVDFVLDGLTPKEYAELVRLAELDNQSFD